MASRTLLYSHDTFGLGNIRRNFLVARNIVSEAPDARVLLLTSSRWFHLFPRHPRIEFVKLPELVRVERGGYEARSQGVDIDPLVRARREILVGAARGFRPDHLLVDKTPLGVADELTATLDWMKRKGRPTTLLLRDILDEPSWTRENWQRTGQYDALEEFYRSVWILGDRRVFDGAAEYAIDQLDVEVRYAGYLGRPNVPIREDRTKSILITVGGGEDGELLVDRVADAIPDNIPVDVVFGPYFPAAAKTQLAGRLAAIGARCTDYVDDLPRRIQQAGAVVSMAGYNTVCEILSTSTPALVLPRTRPAREQLIRARAMSQLGYFESVDPDTATADDLRSKLTHLIEHPNRRAPRPDLEGVQRITSWALAS